MRIQKDMSITKYLIIIRFSQRKLHSYALP